MRWLIPLACLCALCRTGWSAQVDDPLQTPAPGSHIIITSDTDYWSGSGSVQPEWGQATIEIQSHTLTIGDASGEATAGMDFSLDAMSMQASYGGLKIVSAKGNTNNRTGTSVHINSLTFNADGCIEIGDSIRSDTAGWQNTLVLGELVTTAAQGEISIGKDSLLQITKSGGTVFNEWDFFSDMDYIIRLKGGTLDVKDGLTLKRGSMRGSGTIVETLTLDSNDIYGNGAPTAKALVAGGEVQRYGKDVRIGTDGGIVSVMGDTSGDAGMVIAGTLSVDGTTAGSKAEVGGSGGGNGLLQANALSLANQGKLVVQQNGKAEFNTAVLADASSITLSNGGIGVFKQSVVMDSQSKIELRDGGIADFGSGGNDIELLGGSVVANTGANCILTGPTSLKMAAAGALYIPGNVTVKANAADSSATGVVTAAAAGGIVLSNTGHMAAGHIRVEMGTNGTAAELFGATLADGTAVTPSGTVESKLFTVAENAHVSHTSAIELSIAEHAQIEGMYRTGSHTAFNRKAVVTGTLASSGTAQIRLGQSGHTGEIHLDGGVLDGTSGPLVLLHGNATSLGEMRASNNARIIGSVNASSSAGGNGFAMAVDGNVLLDGSSTMVEVETYSQTAGLVANCDSFSGQGLVVRDTTAQAQVSGAQAKFAASAVFEGGAHFSNGATLAGAGNIITTTASGKKLTVDASGKIDLARGDLTVRSFERVDLDGTLIAGYDTTADRVNQLHVENGTVVHFGTTAQIDVSESFASALYNRGDFTNNGSPSSQDQIIVGDIVAPPGFGSEGFLVSNVFGDYRFKYTPGSGIWVDSYQRSSLGDVSNVRKRLTDMWGTDRISPSFAANVSHVAVNMADKLANGGTSMLGAYALPGSRAGNLNYAILSAMASGDSVFNRDGSYGATSGRVDGSLLSAYTGHLAAGPMAVALETSSEMNRQILRKMAVERELIRQEDQAAVSDSALPAMILKERAANRAWADGVGVWQNADRRHGQAGYKYTGGGVVSGYDRVLGNYILGGAFGYVAGSYKDKAAQAHDSHIDQYSFAAYAGYAGSSMWHASMSAGFTLSDNDLREFRGGNWDRAEYNTRTWYASGRIGFDCPVWENFTLSPALGLTYMYASANSHDWRYDDVALLQYRGLHSSTVQMPLDLAMEYGWTIGPETRLKLASNLGYVYTFNDDALNGSLDILGMAGVIPIRALGRKSGHSSYTMGSGLTLAHGRMDLGLRYEYYGKPDYRAHKLTGSFGLKF